jgi:hypothetical protein
VMLALAFSVHGRIGIAALILVPAAMLHPLTTLPGAAVVAMLVERI